MCKPVPSMAYQILSLHTSMSIPVKAAKRGSEGYKYLNFLELQNLNLKYLYKAITAISLAVVYNTTAASRPIIRRYFLKLSWYCKIRRYIVPSTYTFLFAFKVKTALVKNLCHLSTRVVLDRLSLVMAFHVDHSAFQLKFISCNKQGVHKYPLYVLP
jgi:hypothetical protein